MALPGYSTYSPASRELSCQPPTHPPAPAPSNRFSGLLCSSEAHGDDILQLGADALNPDVLQ